MALSLDYMGKYVLMMVAILVAIGFIFTMKGQITDFLGGLGPEDDKGVENVKISRSSSTARATKISDLIAQCYKSKIGSGIKDMTCFLVVTDSGTFNLQKDQIQNLLTPSLAQNVEFANEEYDRETIIISYDSTAGKIIVEKP